jgi:hypothetical protein
MSQAMALGLRSEAGKIVGEVEVNVAVKGTVDDRALAARWVQTLKWQDLDPEVRFALGPSLRSG